MYRRKTLKHAAMKDMQTTAHTSMVSLPTSKEKERSLYLVTDGSYTTWSELPKYERSRGSVTRARGSAPNLSPQDAYLDKPLGGEMPSATRGTQDTILAMMMQRPMTIAHRKSP